MRHTYRAFKTWHDIRHYIHEDSTETAVIWTTDVEKAKVCHTWNEAATFFFDHLGFNSNSSLPDSLKTCWLTD